MKRKFLALTLGVLLSFSLVACGGQTENTSQVETEESTEIESEKEEISEDVSEETELETEETSEEETKEEVEEESTEEVKEESEDTEVVSSELETVDFKNLKFTLNGEEYSLPMTVNDFLAKGWVIDDEDAAEVLSADQYTLSVSAVNPDGVKVYIRAINLTDEDKTFVECNLYGISAEINIFDEEKSPTFNIFGATLGQTTIEDFDAFYTEVERAHNGDTRQSRTLASESTSYYSDNTVEYAFGDGVLNEIKISYMD